MTDHDPLCRQTYWEGGNCFDCRLIAKVRADEQEKRDVHWERVLYDSQARHEEKVAAAAKFARADEREQIAQAIEAEVNQWNPESFVDYRAGLRNAARIARSGGGNPHD